MPEIFFVRGGFCARLWKACRRQGFLRGRGKEASKKGKNDQQKNFAGLKGGTDQQKKSTGLEKGRISKKIPALANLPLLIKISR